MIIRLPSSGSDRVKVSKPLTILVLDDDSERMRQFSEQFTLLMPIPRMVYYTITSKGAIEVLTNSQVDIAFLDHDLGGTANAPSGLGTGYEVARFIESNRDRQPGYTVVHSLNFSGAVRMSMAIKEQVRIFPFAWLNAAEIIQDAFPVD